LFVLGSTGVLIVACCIAVLFARHRFNRHHRIDPQVPTDAPVTWLADPRAPARLHRRLARVGTATTRVIEDHQPRTRIMRKAEPTPVQAAASELREQAVAVDRQVARLSALAPAARRAPMAAAARSVADLEAACARLGSSSHDVQTPRALAVDDPTLVDVTQRIERLAQAHRELLALDDAAGLVGPNDPTVAER